MQIDEILRKILRDPSSLENSPYRIIYQFRFGSPRQYSDFHKVLAGSIIFYIQAGIE